MKRTGSAAKPIPTANPRRELPPGNTASHWWPNVEPEQRQGPHLKAEHLTQGCQRRALWRSERPSADDLEERFCVRDREQGRQACLTAFLTAVVSTATSGATAVQPPLRFHPTTASVRQRISLDTDTPIARQTKSMFAPLGANSRATAQSSKCRR